MANICYNCGKTAVMGDSHRHKRGVAGKRWRNRTTRTSRAFKPNLQKISILVNGKKKSILMCAKCIKKYKKSPTYASNSALG